MNRYSVHGLPRYSRWGKRWTADEDAICALLPSGQGSGQTVAAFARLTRRTPGAVETRRDGLRCRRAAARLRRA